MNKLYAKKGSILIVVLWSLFFLGLLALALTKHLIPHLSLAGKLRQRMIAYSLARAGVERSISMLDQDATEAYDTYADGWTNDENACREVMLGIGSFTVSSTVMLSVDESARMLYGVADEERKVNINTASYTVLKKLVELVADTVSQDAEEIADAIIDWRDEDDSPREHGAENGYYQDYRCKNGPFQVLEELLLVKGMTPEVYNALHNYITIYGTGSININTASKPVLISLGLTEELIEKIFDYRAGDDGEVLTDDDYFFEQVQTICSRLEAVEGLSEEEKEELELTIGRNLLSVRSDNFQAQSSGIVPGMRVPRKIVFVFNRNKVIKYWREN